MSIVHSFLLFLICISSIHACNARPLGATGMEPKNKIYPSNKNDGKESSVKTSVSVKTKNAWSNEVGAGNGSNKIKESEADEDEGKPISPQELREETIKASGASQSATESTHESITWRKPHRKHGDHQPGFNLDYSPPKTHPPVHN